MAADGEWMLKMLESVLPYDDFTAKLVEIYKKVSLPGQPPQQPIHLGINRSDYMLHGKVWLQSMIASSRYVWLVLIVCPPVIP